jgi:hypothetical protein
MSNNYVFQQPTFKHGFSLGTLNKASTQDFMARALIKGMVDLAPNFVQVITNATVGPEGFRIRSTTFGHDAAFKSALETNAVNEVSNFNPQYHKARTLNAYLKVRKLELEKAAAWDDLLGTEYQEWIQPNTAMVDIRKSARATQLYLEREIMTPIAEQVQKLVIYGDHKANDRYVNQMDGFFKRLVKAAGNTTMHSIAFRIPNGASGTKYHISVSGTQITVPYTTNLATTLTAIATAINAVLYKGAQLVEAVVEQVSGADALVVRSNEHQKNVDVRIIVNTAAKGDFKNLIGQVDGGVEILEDKSASGQSAPVKIPQLDLTTGTVTQKVHKVIEWFIEYENACNFFAEFETPEMRKHTKFISQEVANLASMAPMVSAYTGQGGSISLEGILSKCVVLPALRKGDTFATYNKNFVLGTNLLSDLMRVETNPDFNTDSLQTRVKAVLGTQIVYTQDVVTNADPAVHNYFGRDLDDFSDAYRPNV